MVKSVILKRLEKLEKEVKELKKERNFFAKTFVGNSIYEEDTHKLACYCIDCPDKFTKKCKTCDARCKITLGDWVD